MTVQDTKTLLLELEGSLLSAGTRSDREALDQMLDESFVEFGASGKVFNKSQIIADLTENPELDVVVSGELVTMLSSDVALITYKCRSANPDTIRISNRSSIWKNMDGQWKIVFHQGTVVETRKS